MLYIVEVRRRGWFAYMDEGIQPASLGLQSGFRGFGFGVNVHGGCLAYTFPKPYSRKYLRAAGFRGRV